MRLILKRQYMIAGALLLLFVVLTIPVNFIISSRTDNLALPQAEEGHGPALLSGQPGIDYADGEISPQVPADPAQYNIRVQQENEMPATQSQWDFDLNRVVVESKILGQMKSNKTLNGIQISREDYKNRMEKIDAQIEQLEAIREDNPSDSATYHRLQSLYMLKSTLKILKSQVVRESRQ